MDMFSSSTKLNANQETTPAKSSRELEKLAVAAFNAGEGRVASAQARALKAGKQAGIYEEIREYLPEITQQYVDRVMVSRATFESRFID